MQDTPPWAIVILTGAIGGLFATLMTFVKLIISRDERMLDAAVTENQAALSAIADTLAAIRTAVQTSADSTREVRGTAGTTAAQVIAVLTDVERRLAAVEGELRGGNRAPPRR